MQYFKEAEELCKLFEINTAKPGAEDFICLCDLYALMSRYGEQYHVTVSDMAVLLMQQRGLSPMVFWSRMKRAIRPLIEADASTLRALGVPSGEVREGHSATCAELAGRIGAYCGAFIAIDDKAAEIAARVARACGRAK